jgi:membrane fusion protein, multidrug efflux system
MTRNPIICLAIMAGPSLLASGARAESSDQLARVTTVRAAASDGAPEIRLTGEIRARFETNVSFRTSGKISERVAEVGQHVGPDQILARLDPQEQQANVESAHAALNSAEAQLTQARLTYERQQTLLRGGYTTRSSYDQAEQVLRTSEAGVASARAALGTAQEQLSYTDLRAGVAGVVTARSAEAGQVVQAGQTTFTTAQDGTRDAVFNIFEALLARPPRSRRVNVALQADPAVKAAGTVREVSPTIDPASGSVKVKVGLDATPPQMTLGAAVVGVGEFQPESAVVLPWGALFRWQSQPAVWVVDPGSQTVTPKPVTVTRYVGDGIVLSGGVAPGDMVVTAGVQLLRPGQKVAPVEGQGNGQ